MEKIKCFKDCPHYREIINHKDERYGYKHKCLLGYYHKINEGSTYASSESEEDYMVIYTDEHINVYWNNRKNCKKTYDYFYSKILPNINAGFAIVISLIALFYGISKEENFAEKTSLSVKQKQRIDSILNIKVLGITHTNVSQLNYQPDTLLDSIKGCNKEVDTVGGIK